MQGKRLLMLGGAASQLVAIEYAKKRGYYVITCDYLPDNPGHKIADEYFNVSTTDMEAVLELAQGLNLDGIVSFASEPGAPTAAFVGNKLGLPSNPFDTVQIMTNKDLFRQFLKENGFNSPRGDGFAAIETARDFINKLQLPVIVKPVDSSGSRGVSLVTSKAELNTAVEYAIEFSNRKRFLVEEYVNRSGPQIHGDGFVWNGKLEHLCLGDHRFNADINAFVPVSTTMPTGYSKEVVALATSELQKVITRLGFWKGPINIEIMIDKDERVYIMEVAPRNGGNMVPQLVRYATGFDPVALTIDAVMDEGDLQGHSYPQIGYHAYYVIHSPVDGVLDRVEIDPAVEKNILEKHLYKKKGEEVNRFMGANCSLGILLLRFSSCQEMRQRIDNMEKYVRVRIQ